LQEEDDFHKQNRAETLEFAYRNRRWRPSLIQGREIVRERSKMLVEIFGS